MSPYIIFPSSICNPVFHSLSALNDLPQFRIQALDDFSIIGKAHLSPTLRTLKKLSKAERAAFPEIVPLSEDEEKAQAEERQKLIAKRSLDKQK